MAPGVAANLSLGLGYTYAPELSIKVISERRARY
jgi:hypothetical protein